MLLIVKPCSLKYLNNFYSLFSSNNTEFFRIKLHIKGLSLLTNCCKNYKLGIQEINRFIMFDALKNNLLCPNTPYALKQVYIRLLFEAYISKIVDN